MNARYYRVFWRVRNFLLLAPAVTTLTAVCCFVFLVQQITAHVEFVYGYSFAQVLISCFGLNGTLLFRGFFWQPFTYIFLHGSWLHLGLNLLTVLLFGSGLEREIGSRRFWQIFLTGGVLGGLGWLAITAMGSGSFASARCLGASGGVFALIGAYAAFFPHREVYLLLVLIPIRMKARTLALLMCMLTIAEAVFLQSQIAYAAHLTGGLAGYFFARRCQQPN